MIKNKKIVVSFYDIHDHAVHLIEDVDFENGRYRLDGLEMYVMDEDVDLSLFKEHMLTFARDVLKWTIDYELILNGWTGALIESNKKSVLSAFVDYPHLVIKDERYISL